MKLLKKNKFILCFSLCAGLSAGAQTLHLGGTYVGDGLQGMQLYANAMDKESNHQSAGCELKITDTHFEGNVPVASDGFYTLYGSNEVTQMNVPLYLPDAQKQYTLTLRMVDGCPRVDLDADNQALSAYNEVVYQKGRYFWMKGAEMKPEQVLPFLKGYREAADSIALHYSCSEPVKQYLTLWAYSMAENSYESIPRAIGKKKTDMPFLKSDLLEEPSTVLDTPMTLYFSSACIAILQSIPKGNLESQLAYLDKTYSCKPLRQDLGEGLVNRYILSFDYNQHFDSGLAELTSAIEKYKLDTRSIKDFKARKASVKGADFPDVLLTDREGNKVDFSQYKGYYVYIDMWASWCGPCCREVPYLQQLEKELKNDRIKFVSISIDKGTKEWKAKMDALNMHGNQLINQDNKLVEALNITGIPHFLIYDKEGKLFQYEASRPSRGEELKQLLEGLR